MLKKLQNLLFEEDEDIEDEEDEVEEPRHHHAKAEQEKVVQQASPVQQEPTFAQPRQVMQEEPQQSMKRIDVTQPIAKQPTEDVKAPTFDSLFAEPEEKKEPVKQPKLGITLDDATKPEQVVKKATPVQQTQQPKKKPAPKASPSVTSGYQFKPVISPIFGVDEKDLDAVKNTARKYTQKEKITQDSNISPIISPMYGRDAEDSPSLIADTVAKSEILEKTVGNAKSFKAEEDIPEFSLDDILSASDSQYKEENQLEETAKMNKVFPEQPNDETLVIDKTKFPSDEGLD